MALPQKHTVTANVQVRGGAARVVALSAAVEFSRYEEGVSASRVIGIAREFESYLTEDGESDEPGDDSDSEQ